MLPRANRPTRARPEPTPARSATAPRHFSTHTHVTTEEPARTDATCRRVGGSKSSARACRRVGRPLCARARKKHMRHVRAHIGTRGQLRWRATVHAVRAAGPSPRCSRTGDRGRSPVREHRDHRPLTRAPQACGHHLCVSRARPVWLTCSWEFSKTRSIILSSILQTHL